MLEENETKALEISETPKVKRRRGFAMMDPAARRAISALGGKKAHANGTAHRWSKEEAQVAGKKGGVAPHIRRGRGPGDKPHVETTS